MKKFIILSLGLLVVISLTGISCGQKAAEKATEKALEKATNGQADVDIGKDTVTINTNGGSYQAGENVSLPSDFPSDIFVTEGKITSVITNSDSKGYTVSIETTESVNDLKSQYEQKLKDDGWTINLTMAYEESASVGGQKGNRTVSVGINPSQDGKTFVVLSTFVTE